MRNGTPSSRPGRSCTNPRGTRDGEEQNSGDAGHRSDNGGVIVPVTVVDARDPQARVPASELARRALDYLLVAAEQEDRHTLVVRRGRDKVSRNRSSTRSRGRATVHRALAVASTDRTAARIHHGARAHDVSQLGSLVHGHHLDSVQHDVLAGTGHQRSRERVRPQLVVCRRRLPRRTAAPAHAHCGAAVDRNSRANSSWPLQASRIHPRRHGLQVRFSSNAVRTAFFSRHRPTHRSRRHLVGGEHGPVIGPPATNRAVGERGAVVVERDAELVASEAGTRPPGRRHRRTRAGSSALRVRTAPWEPSRPAHGVHLVLLDDGAPAACSSIQGHAPSARWSSRSRSARVIAGGSASWAPERAIATRARSVYTSVVKFAQSSRLNGAIGQVPVQSRGTAP